MDVIKLVVKVTWFSPRFAAGMALCGACLLYDCLSYGVRLRVRRALGMSPPVEDRLADMCRGCGDQAAPESAWCVDCYWGKPE